MEAYTLQVEPLGYYEVPRQLAALSWFGIADVADAAGEALVTQGRV